MKQIEGSDWIFHIYSSKSIRKIQNDIADANGAVTRRRKL
jgi:hypothetical protein